MKAISEVNRPYYFETGHFETGTYREAWQMVVEKFEITIPSDTLAGQAIQERVVAILEQLDYPPRDIFGVRLALEEALVNAIKHGNRLDPAKSVQIACQIGKDSVRIEIEDQGDGFQINDVPDPTMEENLDRPSGRGIMLMRAFLSAVEYNELGNKVILEKQRGTAPAN